MLTNRVIIKGIDLLIIPVMSDPIKDIQTIITPVFIENSPEAKGRYGLLILSMSTSKIWFSPTIKIFIITAEDRAKAIGLSTV